MQKIFPRPFPRSSKLGLFACLGAIVIWLLTAAPSQAHWADLAAAELVVNATTVDMTLTYPTGLTPFADDNQNGQLSTDEVHRHASALQTFLSRQIQLVNSENQAGALAIQPIDPAALPPTVKVAPNTHSTLKLTYSWVNPVQGLKMHYNLFLPGVPTASCLATVLQTDQLKTFVFTPKRQTFALAPGLPGYASGGIVLAIVGSFLWGATHSMSPGHGKTLVSAYLLGERATPLHAVFLAVATTITHTIGIFALGLITLFASRYILPEQLYPWIGLVSGLFVMSIGFSLLRNRLKKHRHGNKQLASSIVSAQDDFLVHASAHDHNHDDICFTSHLEGDRHSSHDHARAHEPDRQNTHHHSYSLALRSHKPSYSVDDQRFHNCTSGHHHSHDRLHIHPDHLHNHSHSHHSHDHPHDHSHDHLHDHTHSHLPPGAGGAPVTWRSLLAFGISGGLIPCPAALVLLLSTIALGKVGLALALVVAFSLGLASVLTGLGLLLVYAKRLFKRVPSQPRLVRILPALSALVITLLGIGISIRSLLQVFGVIGVA